MKNKRLSTKPATSLTQRLSQLVVVLGLVGFGVLGYRYQQASHAYTGDHAQCVSASYSKTTVTTNENFSATIKMQNDGTTTWTAAKGYTFFDLTEQWHFTGNTLSFNVGPGTNVTFRLGLQAPSTPGTKQLRGAIAINGARPAVSLYCDAVNINVVAPVTIPVGQPPTGSPSPQPSPSSSAPKRTTTTGNASPQQGGTPSADTSPPSTPTDFVANADDQNKTVKLSWTASTDDVGVQGYTIQRSTDQQNWEDVADNITDTNFEDNTVSFGSKFYYQVQAFDAAGNKSDFASTDVTTSGFEANAFADKDSHIDSEDGLVTIFMPSGAVSEDLFCGVQIVNNVLSPDIESYQLASGPYQISCRNKDGTVIGSFDKPLSASIKLGSNSLKKAGKLAYYGQKDTNWQSLKVSAHDKKAKTDTVQLDGHQIFVIMKQHHKQSVFVVLLKVLLVLALIAGGVLAFLRFRMRRRLQGQYDDYLHKSRGY